MHKIDQELNNQALLGLVSGCFWRITFIAKLIAINDFLTFISSYKAKERDKIFTERRPSQ